VPSCDLFLLPFLSLSLIFNTFIYIFNKIGLLDFKVQLYLFLAEFEFLFLKQNIGIFYVEQILKDWHLKKAEENTLF
jgi:hypothetical protein